MNIIEAILLGIVQGITEFLPISSSGHLIIFSNLFSGHSQDLAFDVALHFGTALAVLIYFFKDWIIMINSLIGDFRTYKFTIIGNRHKLRPESLMMVWIPIILLPVAVIGYLFESSIDNIFRKPIFVAGMLILGSILMWLADVYSKKVERQKQIKSNMKFIDALLISVSQILAFIPGTSRSGITLTAGMFLKYRAPDVAKFSFILSTPLILAASVLLLPDLLNSGMDNFLLTFVGFLSAFLTGIFVIKWFLGYLKTHSLNLFIIYRIILGLIILLFIF